jgi:hypothetical protein
VMITGYILIGIQLEEHDLILQFGDQYRHYRRHAAMIVPFTGRKFTGSNTDVQLSDDLHKITQTCPSSKGRKSSWRLSRL